MERLPDLLRAYPELALFASIAIGHVIGRVHVKGVGFGSVVSAR